MKNLTRADEISNIGLDIGRSSIKAIQLAKRQDGSIALLAYASKNLPTTAVDSILHPPHYLPALSSLLSMPNYGEFVGREFAVSLPSRHTYVQQNVSADEFVQQANLVLGTTVEELLINTYQHSPSNSVSIASAQNIIRPHLDALSSVGEVTKTDHELSAAMRAFGTSSSQTILVDIGNISTTVATYSTFLESTQIINFSIHSLVTAVAKKLDISPNQANELLFTSGFLESSLQIKIHEATNLGIAELVNILHSLAKLSVTPQILLCGGGACIPGVASYLQHLLKIPVDIADPWNRVGKYPLKPIPRKIAPMFGTAIGLALLGLG